MNNLFHIHRSLRATKFCLASHIWPAGRRLHTFDLDNYKKRSFRLVDIKCIRPNFYYFFQYVTLGLKAIRTLSDSPTVCFHHWHSQKFWMGKTQNWRVLWR